MKKRFWLGAAGLAAGAALMAAAPGYKVVDHIPIGGTGTFWDYMWVDPDAARLYMSHFNQTEVIDLKTNKIIGTVMETPRIHGIAVAPDLGKGFTANGGNNTISVFDLKTFKNNASIPAGTNPDSIVYEPTSHRVLAFNGNSKDVTIVDAKTEKVVATVPVGGKPEYSQVDGKGKVFVNIEDTAELIEIDAAKATVTRRLKMDGCEDPTGLSMDRKKGRLFAACKGVMAAVEIKGWKMLGTAPTGAGADGVVFDDGRVFTSNGTDGTMTVIAEQGGKWVVEETVPTMRSARTIGVDSKTHKIYLPAAENGPAPTGKDGKAKGRGPVLPETFQLLVVSR